MVDSKYKKDVEFIYSNRDCLTLFKKRFFEARDSYAKRNSWGKGKNKAWFEDAFEHILKKYNFGQMKLENIADVQSDRGNNIVKNAFKPLSNDKINSSAYGAALLMWMCWRTPSIADDLYVELNKFKKEGENSLEFKPYAPNESKGEKIDISTKFPSSLIDSIRREQRYDKIAVRLISVWEEFEKIGAPKFDMAAMNLSAGKTSDGVNDFHLSLKKLEAVFALYKRSRLYFKRESRGVLDTLAEKIYIRHQQEVCKRRCNIRPL